MAGTLQLAVLDATQGGKHEGRHTQGRAGQAGVGGPACTAASAPVLSILLSRHHDPQSSRKASLKVIVVSTAPWEAMEITEGRSRKSGVHPHSGQEGGHWATVTQQERAHPCHAQKQHRGVAGEEANAEALCTPEAVPGRGTGDTEGRTPGRALHGRGGT